MNLRYIVFIGLLFCFSSTLKSQFVLNGNAVLENGSCYQLTSGGKNEASSIWYLKRADLSKDFSIQFSMYLGCGGGGADGIAFVMQPVGTGLGASGGGLGYYGMTPSLAVEFDTWRNAGSSDPSFDHMGILKNGSNTHYTANSLVDPVRILNDTTDEIVDCEYHDVNIYWHADFQFMEVYVDCEIRLAYQGDIVKDIFSDNPKVYVGFTASTGNEANEQKVCFNYLSTRDSIANVQACKDELIQVKAPRGFKSYSWYPTEGVSNPKLYNPYFSPSESRKYSVNMSDNCGIVNKESFNFTVDPRPLPTYTYSFTGQTTEFWMDSTDLISWTWDFGDRSPLSSEVSPSHEYSQTGSYTACLITESECGKDTSCFEINLDGGSGTGGSPNSVKNKELNWMKGIFPSPITGTSKLQLSASSVGGDISVTDLLGRKIAISANPVAINGAYELELNRADFPNAGWYLITLTNSAGQESLPFIVR